MLKGERIGWNELFSSQYHAAGNSSSQHRSQIPFSALFCGQGIIDLKLLGVFILFTASAGAPLISTCSEHPSKIIISSFRDMCSLHRRVFQKKVDKLTWGNTISCRIRNVNRGLDTTDKAKAISITPYMTWHQNSTPWRFPPWYDASWEIRPEDPTQTMYFLPRRAFLIQAGSRLNKVIQKFRMTSWIGLLTDERNGFFW